jgi:hypothetical protein
MDRRWTRTGPPTIRSSEFSSVSARAPRGDLAPACLACSLHRSRFMHTPRRKVLASLALAVALGGAAVAALSHPSKAKADPSDQADANARCATRLSIALLGDAPTKELLGSQTPQASVDGMLATPAFRDRWASFVNAKFNGGPAADPLTDTVYFMARWVVANDKPWKDLFIGAYDVVASTDKKSLDVVPNANGLGYFRTKPWMLRYAGNEEAGIRISAAYHMLQNTTGFAVPASVAKPGEDRSASGRQASGCSGCHYTSWFALDKAAAVLSRKKVDGNGNVTFDASTVTPTPLLGKTLTNDADLVNTLVASDYFLFAQCRLVFEFLYGRVENQCEAPVFDKCVDALKSTGKIQPAIAAVAKDAAYCQ